MNFFESAILGLVQGLTEFIPVSSTGHLILARNMLGLPLVGSISFDAILQLATGLAVLVYFSQDIWNIIKNRNYKLFWALVVGSIPVVILGLFLEKYMDTIFRGTHVVAYALILGAILFYFAEKFNRPGSQTHHPALTKVGKGEDNSAFSSLVKEECHSDGEVVVFETFSSISVWRGLGIGLFQCLALIPGMSRSGSTISGGLFLGVNREMAIRFSFLLSLPIIFGSGLKKVWDLVQIGNLAQVESSLYVASFFAFISGLLAIHLLLKFLKNHSLNYFGVYRIILAVVVLTFL
jgi:undecaprenyl-diphosphatase